mmetsp:Transcript_73701/g.227775  ORF Transcript_73701/g.227775 Transcript_73701/m.227775 type:complete len:289 (+) Transcript_73701:411-1277(+)
MRDRQDGHGDAVHARRCRHELAHVPDGLGRQLLPPGQQAGTPPTGHEPGPTDEDSVTALERPPHGIAAGILGSLPLEDAVLQRLATPADHSLQLAPHQADGLAMVDGGLQQLQVAGPRRRGHEDAGSLQQVLPRESCRSPLLDGTLQEGVPGPLPRKCRRLVELQILCGLGGHDGVRPVQGTCLHACGLALVNSCAQGADVEPRCGVPERLQRMDPRPPAAVAGGGPPLRPLTPDEGRRQSLLEGITQGGHLRPGLLLRSHCGGCLFPEVRGLGRLLGSQEPQLQLRV